MPIPGSCFFEAGMYRLVLILCLTLAAMLVLMTLRQSAGQPDADFVFNNGNEVNSLDPHRISWRHDIRIANALFEGLMAFRIDPPAPGASLGEVGVAPGVAQRHEVGDDGKTYTFHLRPDARWSNGAPLTASDFVWSWKRVMTPITGADYAAMMFVIRGAREYYQALEEGQEVSFESVGLRAPDDHTLVVELAAPTSYFLELTAFVPFVPVYRPLLEQHVFAGEKFAPQNGIAAYDEAWTRPGTIVCNGPFVLAEHRFKSEMVLAKNPHYWDRDNVQLQRVRALAVTDLNASIKTYQSGQCDFIDGVSRGAARALIAMPPAERPADFRAVPSFGTYFYRFNCTARANGGANPLADPRVRRALAMAIDKDEIVREVTGLGQPRADSFVPPGLHLLDRRGESCTYQSRAGLKFDPAAARALLKEAGFDRPSDLGEIRLMYNVSGDHQLIADRVAAMWRANLGVNAMTDVKDSKAFGQALKTKQQKGWHAARGSWFGDYRDPTTFLEMFTTGDGNNDSGYSNPVVDDLFARAAATDDQAIRLDLLAQAEDIIVSRDAAVVPLYHYLDLFMVRPSVQGAWPNAMGMFLLKQVAAER